MNKKILFFIQLIVIMALPLLVSADITNPLSGASTFNQLLCKISDFVAGLIGALAGIMFVIAGAFYLTSAGNPQRVNVAKTALMYAIAGAAIALAAKGIVEAIVEILGGAATTC